MINYFRVPSIAHYLKVDVEERLIGHHRAGADGTIVTAIAAGETLALDPPGIMLTIADLFAA